MREAISIVLAGLLVVLPLHQVQAQVAQQEAESVQRTAQPEGAAQTEPPEGAAHLFHVPPLAENAALLWGHAGSSTPLIETDPLPGFVPSGVFEVEPVEPPRASVGKVVGITLLVIVVIAGAVLIGCELSVSKCGTGLKPQIP